MTTLSPRAYTLLVWASVVTGLLAFVDAVWLSQLLIPADPGSSVELTPFVVLLTVLFPLLVGACIVLGYVAARRRPPRDEG
jgi:hypothetical protein